MDWVVKNPEFAQRYHAAKKLRADWAAQRTIDVAENSTPETVAVDRLKVDVYRWHASKLDAQAYGDKASEVHVSNTVNNCVVLTQERILELQEARRKALER